jgi:RimJ/RimL family protein N-acetyltransferase
MEKAGMRYEGTFDDTDSEGNRALRHRYAIHANEYRSQG